MRLVLVVLGKNVRELLTRRTFPERGRCTFSACDEELNLRTRSTVSDLFETRRRSARPTVCEVV